MNPPTKLFRAPSIGAAASLMTVVLLMLGNPFLVLTFFVCIVYAVVPFSLWYKHRTVMWRGCILFTCVVGFGLIALSVILEMIDLRHSDEYELYLSGFASLKAAFLAGVVFLPLACFGSMHSLLTALRTRRDGDAEKAV